MLISISTKFKLRFNFVTSTKHQQQNTDQTSTSKSWPKCSKSEQKLSVMTKPQLPNLQQTVANTILISSNSNNLNKFWLGIFTRQGHINQVYKTVVSQSVSAKHCQWSDSGLTKTVCLNFSAVSVLWIELPLAGRTLTFFTANYPQRKSTRKILSLFSWIFARP